MSKESTSLVVTMFLAFDHGVLNSALRGFVANALRPTTPGTPTALQPLDVDLDILFTAETHNFPCAVSTIACDKVDSKGGGLSVSFAQLFSMLDS